MKKNLKIYAFLLSILMYQISFAQKEKIAKNLRLTIAKTIENIKDIEPSRVDPVALQSTLVWSEDRTQFAIIMKVNILDNWHIYAYVPDTQPYITTKIKLETPENVTPINDWEKPEVYAHDEGVYIYKGTLIFSRCFSVKGPLKPESILSCGLYYQACDLYQCYPPRTKMITILN
ncbi:protein-disulfide reductase DsbD domain-containing protein [Zobellia nedashkovskayae]